MHKKLSTNVFDIKNYFTWLQVYRHLMHKCSEMYEAVIHQFWLIVALVMPCIKEIIAYFTFYFKELKLIHFGAKNEPFPRTLLIGNLFLGIPIADFRFTFVN